MYVYVLVYISLHWVDLNIILRSWNICFSLFMLSNHQKSIHRRLTERKKKEERHSTSIAWSIWQWCSYLVICGGLPTRGGLHIRCYSYSPQCNTNNSTGSIKVAGLKFPEVLTDCTTTDSATKTSMLIYWLIIIIIF